MPTTVKFRMDADDLELAPRKAHIDDAAYDLCASKPATVPAGGTVLVHTGLYLELPVGFEAQVRPRSGLALKQGVTVLNSPGTIDAGYRGEVGVILYNAGGETFAVNRGDRVAQMVIQRLPDVELVNVDELAQSGRGHTGFGSTGTA